jgi:Ca2+:H+ antiporter
MLSVLTNPQRIIVALAVALSLAAGLTEVAGAPQVARFIVAGFALAALAALVGQAIEQVGEHLAPGPTGLVQSALGNLPELFVGIFALRAGLTGVVQAALVGSVLSNVLLVLGLAFVTGGLRHGAQRFAPEGPRMLVTLLMLAVAALLVPTLAFRLDTPAGHHAGGLSNATAVVLLAVYAASIPFWLRGGPDRANAKAEPAPEGGVEQTSVRSGPTLDLSPDGLQTAAVPAQAASPPHHLTWPIGLALALLALGSLGAAVVSDWFVSALTSATTTLGLSSTFTGLVVVAIASNAVENAVGIRFALKARPDYAISTILNSPLQAALLLTPALVLVSRVVGPHKLTLVFPTLLVAALAVAVVVVVIVVYDGEYSWLEGVALVALYGIIAAAFWWG